MIYTKKSKGFISRKLAVGIVIALLLLNLGAVLWLFFQAKASADSIKTASENVGANKFTQYKVKLPQNDVKGEDLVFLKRYPNSVRTDYRTIGDKKEISYQTKDNLNIVLAYFKTELSSSEFILVSSNNEKIVFSKENKEITIQATVEEGLTNIKITY